MILVKLHFFFLMLLQRVPPPPNAQPEGPTPVGGLVPLDISIWILLIIAVVMIVYVTIPRSKKAA